MELRIKDRLLLPLLLPKEGNFQQFNLKKSILAKVEVTEKERSEINLHENPDNGRVEWDTEKDTPMEPLFTQEEMDYLKTACEQLSDKVLNDEMWGVVEKVYDALQAIDS